MQIQIRVIGNVTILDLKGKMTLGEGDELLKDTILDLLRQEHRLVILNLANVPYIDSAGLGEIVRVHTILNRQQGKLVLTRLQKDRQVENLLRTTGCDRWLAVCETEEEALRTINQGH